MEITNLTFIVTDDCNFNCSYCFQEKEKRYMDHGFIESAVDLFYPLFKSGEKIDIGFYGGEPLLAYEQIKHAVLLLQEKNRTQHKKIAYSVTSNGSLLCHEMLDFFCRNNFSLMLSFDGLAQDKGRQPGTLKKTLEAMKRIRDYPGIDLEINSVFAPQTVADFSDSLHFIIQQGGAEITFNLSTMADWRDAHIEILKQELAKLVDFLVSLYKEEGRVPVKNFRTVSKTGIFGCGAGQDKIAVTPTGELWGCFLFHDYFKTRTYHPQYLDYHLGTLAEFAVDHENHRPGILANYSELRQDLFGMEQGACFLCADLNECVVCPVNAAYSSGFLGKISCRHCELVKIQRQAKKDFLQKIGRD